MEERQYYPGSPYQEFFNFMNHNHGLTLTESEMNEIIEGVHKLFPSQPPAHLDIDHVLSNPPPGHDNIPFDPSILKQMEGHEQRADKSWEDIQKRISQPAAVNGVVSQDAHEKEVMMKAFDKIRDLFEKRSWIMEGRGCYPYNDDRYKEEVRYMYDEFDTLFKETWANIETKSFEYRQQIIAQYLKDNPPAGAVWVKASIRLPEDHASDIHWRLAKTKKPIANFFYISLGVFKAEYVHGKASYDLKDLEWLDESGAAQVQIGAVWVKAYLNAFQNYLIQFADKTDNEHHRSIYNMHVGDIFTALSVLEKYPDFVFEQNVYRDESPTAAGDTEEEIFDQYRAIKEKIGKLGYNTFINSKEVEEYREWLRNGRYKHRLKWFEKEYPNGLYSRDADGELFGISILTMKFLAEADAAYEKATAAGDGEARETIENILYATGKFYQEQCTELADVILKEVKGAGDGKEDAVAFMNWTLSSECDTYNCTDEDEWTNIYTKQTLTTAQLYDIFKQQNK